MVAGKGSVTLVLACLLAAGCGSQAARPRVSPRAAVTPVPTPSIEPSPSPSPSEEPSPPPPVVVAAPVRLAKPLPPPPPPIPSLVLQVPWTDQAPMGDWKRDYESCEEAASVMIHHYLSGDRSVSIPAQQAENEITALRDWEVKTWGSEPDLSMQKLGELNQGFYGHSFQVLPANQDSITAQLRAGHPVVVPATTGVLRGGGNGNFGHSRNLYHVLLIKGVDFAAGRVITNDAGVTAGRNWEYTWNVIDRAMDDANTKIPEGHVMVVIN